MEIRPEEPRPQAEMSRGRTATSGEPFVREAAAIFSGSGLVRPVGRIVHC